MVDHGRELAAGPSPCGRPRVLEHLTASLLNLAIAADRAGIGAGLAFGSLVRRTETDLPGLAAIR